MIKLSNFSGTKTMAQGHENKYECVQFNKAIIISTKQHPRKHKHNINIKSYQGGRHIIIYSVISILK